MVRSIAARLSNAPDEELQLLASEFLLRYCDQLVFAPDHWESFGPQRQEAIVKFRRATNLNKASAFIGSAGNLFVSGPG